MGEKPQATRAAGSDPRDPRGRTTREWVESVLAHCLPAVVPGRPMPELLDRLDAGACLDECELIDDSVCQDGCALAIGLETAGDYEGGR